LAPIPAPQGTQAMTSQIVSVCMVFENDATLAADVVHELHATLSARFENFEILAVDNGSTDDTVSRLLAAAEPLDNIRILILAKQYDIEIASFAALENAIGDYVVLFEPRTDPCHVAPQLVAKCMEGHDLVSGKAEDRCDDTGWRPLFSTLFRNLGRLSGVHNLQDVWSSCFCFNRTTLNAIIQIKDKVRSLRFISAEIGHTRAMVPYRRAPRSDARSRFWTKLSSGVGVIFASSDRPLRIMNIATLLLSLGNFLYIFYVGIFYLFKTDTPQGWTSTSMVLASTFAILSLALCVLGEYQLLIYKEARKGPLYHIAREVDRSHMFEKISARNVV